MRVLLCTAAMALLCGACLAQPAGMHVFPLKWADAATVVAMLGGAAPPDAAELHDCRQAWVDDFAGRVARQLPRDLARVEPRWYYASSTDAVPREQMGAGERGSLSRLLPAGLAAPPTVLAGQNAVLARGTPAAIDQLRELIALIDVKPRMVNVEVKLVDAPASRSNEWGIDGAVSSGDLLIASRGNMPSGGVQAHGRRRNARGAMGWDQTSASGQVVTGANVTTTNNFPAIATFGRLIPFFTSQVAYGPYGDRIVTTSVDAIFIGTELFVQPRINSDDTVTMLLRPTFIEAVGAVRGPDGTTLPVTETVATVTQVTVPDGETLQLGGFERSLDEYNTKFSGVLRAGNVRVQSHPALFVTPRIIRDS